MNKEARILKVRRGANIRQEGLGGSRGAGGSVLTGGWRSVLHVIRMAKSACGALDTLSVHRQVWSHLESKRGGYTKNTK